MGEVDRVSQSPSASYILCVKHTEVFMPKGPNGEKRPADAIGLAVMIGKIATWDLTDPLPEDGKNRAAQELGRKGGKARASSLTSEQKSDIAKKAAEKRWGKKEA